MYSNGNILMGKTKEGKELNLLLNKANRHGVISGASGSGKTITLKVMAEGFSNAGVPVFLADVKGDLAGTAVEGVASDSLNERLQNLKIDNFEYQKFPVRFWDIFGTNGHAVRTTPDNIGVELLAMMLGLNETQEGNLAIVFRIAKDMGMKLDDLKDLRLMLQYIADNKDEYITKYGNITAQSIGVIQRSLLALENQGADNFFGNPSLDIHDFIAQEDGKGVINILHSVELFQSPDLYASFLLWLLNSLFNSMPEVGDLDKPKMVFFFDEAHLLFKDMPAYRLKTIIQVVKLIRSRGIGLYFISQSITDIPDDILSQLGNRVQHTLRAYTPSEQKNIKAAADSFRTNPKFNTQEAIEALGTGEALISFQTENGEPEIVEKATILPPQSKMGVIDDITRSKIINSSMLVGKYDTPVERDSAFEELDKMIREKVEQEEKEKLEKEEQKQAEKANQAAAKEAEKEALKKAKEEEKAKEKKSKNLEKLGNRMLGNAVSQVERKIINNVLKNFFK